MWGRQAYAQILSECLLKLEVLAVGSQQELINSTVKILLLLVLSICCLFTPLDLTLATQQIPPPVDLEQYAKKISIIKSRVLVIENHLQQLQVSAHIPDSPVLDRAGVLFTCRPKFVQLQQSS